MPPPAPARAHRWPTREHPRKVLLLMGCVQPAMLPNINSATARVLDAAGIQTLVADDAGCCGAIRLHLSDHDGALDHMRRNIDAWWPLVAAGGVEAIVMNASGCGVTVKEYGHSLRHDPAYADKASRIADLTRDLCELLPDIVPALAKKLSARAPKGRLAFPPALHPATRPATARRRRDASARARLRRPGRAERAHLCCGSAGTYSVLQPELACRCATASSANLAALDARDHRLGQHRLHPAPAERHGDAGAALDRGARRRAGRRADARA